MRARLVLLSAIAIAVVAAVAYVAARRDDSTATALPAGSAPQPVEPPDGLTFVESDLVLRWDWPPDLADGQTFALRLWADDVPPQEIWTADSALNARDLIDSFSRDWGAFHWQVAVVRFSETDGFLGMASEWSPVRTLNRVRRISPTPYPAAQQSELARLVVDQKLEQATALIDFARHFIFTHTHDTRQDQFAPDYSDALAMMLAASRGEGDAPYLLCDGQSTAMLTLLQELGIESRLIFLYSDGDTKIHEHTVLEVFNPDTQRWEVHDPLNDNTFIDTADGQRASAERLVFGPLDTVEGCVFDGTCGPEHMAFIRDYLEAFRYGYTDTFWVNPDRFDISRRFADNDNRNLAEYLTGNPREFQFRFDSWER